MLFDAASWLVLRTPRHAPRQVRPAVDTGRLATLRVVIAAVAPSLNATFFLVIRCVRNALPPPDVAEETLAAARVGIAAVAQGLDATLLLPGPPQVTLVEKTIKTLATLVARGAEAVLGLDTTFF